MRKSILTFESLADERLVHGVTTRFGGVSSAPWDTLNLSWMRPDDPTDVLENRRRVCAELDIPIERLTQAGQIHDIGVRVVTEDDAGRGGMTRASVLPPSDAVITNTPDVYLFACFADCVPLIFYDPRQQATGIAHAGWRGTVGGIGRATVAAFVEHFGSTVSDIRVVIGPSAGPERYEVGPEVLAAVREKLPQPERLLSRHRGEHAHLDLWEANRQVLLASGILPEHIEVSGICTIEHADQFFSHRAADGKTGRFAALAGVRSIARNLQEV